MVLVRVCQCVLALSCVALLSVEYSEMAAVKLKSR